MKISVKKENFLNALTVVTKAIKRGSNYPILECVLIDTNKDKIVFTCTDGKEITIKKEIEGDILEKGRVAIDGMFLTEVVRSMPQEKDILLEIKKDMCELSCGKTTNKSFPIKDEASYPNIMNINKDNKVIINEYKLKKIIEKTSISYERVQVSDNPIFKGIYFSIDKEKIIAKSMNGFVLSIINETLMKDFGKYEAIIPGFSLEEVNKLIKGDVDKDVQIYFNDKSVTFEFNNTLFTTTVISGTYINTDKILNMEKNISVSVNRYSLIESLERSIPFSNELDKKPVVFEIKDDEMDICLNSINGDSFENIKIKKSGKDLRIAFNPKLFLYILNVIDDEEVYMHFSGSKQPVIIKDKQETYTYLLTAVNY